MIQRRKHKKTKTKSKPRVSTSPANKLGSDVAAKHRTHFDDILDYEEGLHGCILLEPREELDDAIIGWDMDGHHVYYSYEKLVAAFYKAFDDEENDEDKLTSAVEWVDYNVVRGVAYMGERRPIIIRSGDQN